MRKTKTSLTPKAQLAALEKIAAVASEDAGESNKAARVSSLQKLAQRHSTYGTSRSAPVREVLHLVGDKWTSLILGVLDAGPCRYSALRQLVSLLSHESFISQRVLTVKLRLMERNGLVIRRSWPSVPPRVEYQLSPLGKSLTQKIEDLLQWAEKNFQAIQQARASFDSAPRATLGEENRWQ